MPWKGIIKGESLKNKISDSVLWFMRLSGVNFGGENDYNFASETSHNSTRKGL